MDKPNTQSIELIVNDVTINFRCTNPKENWYASRISVAGYKMTNEGIYFVYDKLFMVEDSYVNNATEKKLFFVPYANIISIETALDDGTKTTNPTENAQTMG